ncbi:MAG: putative metal-dependent hydrolase [Cellulophaga sp.]
MDLEALRYPIGHFQRPEIITETHISTWVTVLEELPKRLGNLVSELSTEQLNTPYRVGGWTVRQVVHHIGDSHHNSYTRFKWALSEDKPVIKAYNEKEWCNSVDAKIAPITLSLNYITALHARLVYMLKGFTEQDLEKAFLHPDGNEEVGLSENIGRYAWHSNHHFAHIENLLIREKWIK